MKRIAAAFALAGALGGCGSTDLAAPRLPTVPGNAQPGQNVRTLARVTIDWGHGRTSHSARPRFISPSAQSLSVSVNGGEPQIADAPVPKNGQKTSLTIDAPAGTDLFEFDLWDRDGATGNLLGSARVTRVIVADQVNAVSAVLDGVCTQIALAPASGQPLLETSYRTGTGSPGTQGQPFYTFVGTSPETIGMTPLDADGNPILGTVPAIALAQAGTNVGGPAVVAISNAGNVATVKPTGEFARGTTGALVASSPQCSSTATVGFETSPAIYAASFYGVSAFDRWGNGLPLGSAAVTGTAYYYEDIFTVYADIFADPETGNIFVSAHKALAAFTPSGSPLASKGAFATNLTGPIDGTIDTANGHIYVLYGGGTDGSGREIAVFDREGNSIGCDSWCPQARAGGLRLQYDSAGDQVCILTSIKTYSSPGLYCASQEHGSIEYPIPTLYVDGAVGTNEIALASDSSQDYTSTSGLFAGPRSVLKEAISLATFSNEPTTAVAIDNDDGDIYSLETSNAGSSIVAFDLAGKPLAPSLPPIVFAEGLAIVSPGPTAILTVPSILAFTAAGQNQTVNVTDTGGAKLAERDTCSGIASVSPGASAGQYEVTASAAGSCVITFTDTLGALTQVTVGVTITHLTGQGTRRGTLR